MWTSIILALILAAAYLLLRRVTAWRREIARALRLEREGKTQEAERILRAVCDSAKDAATGLRATAAGFHLGAFLMRARRYQEAMEELREPLTHGHLDAENELTIRSMIRTALQARGMLDLAEDEERRMLELVSRIQDPSLQAEWRGQLLVEQGRPDEAAECFGASVKQAPPRQLGRVVGRALKAANAYRLAGGYEEAKEAARHTIELRPPPAQMAMAFSILASANTSIGDLDAAEIAAREARRLAEQIGDEHLRAHGLRLLAGLAFMRGEYDRAEAAVKSIEEIDAPRAELYLLQGEIMRHRGRFDSAIGFYDLAANEAEEHNTGFALTNLKASAVLAAAWAEFERGNAQSALARLEEAPKTQRLLRMLRRDEAAQRAIYLAALGRKDQSNQEMERARAIDKEIPDSRYARIARASQAGLHNLLLARPHEAAEEFRTALAESPPPKDQPRLRFHLALALEAAGDTKGAERELESAASAPEGDIYSLRAREKLA